MRIVFQHLPANVACDSHKGLLAGLALGESGNASVPEIVETQLQVRTLESRAPRGAPRLDRT
jgi:hypothetical protein